MTTESNWDAVNFFQTLTDNNLLAKQHGFVACRVSGLKGFEDALAHLQSSTAFVCISDSSEGFTELNNTPRTRQTNARQNTTQRHRKEFLLFLLFLHFTAHTSSCLTFFCIFLSHLCSIAAKKARTEDSSLCNRSFCSTITQLSNIIFYHISPFKTIEPRLFSIMKL